MPSLPVTDRKPKLAIVLFNLGAPDSLQAVWPFLRNLFSDPAILRVPFFVRPLLARLIARARLKPASENYALLGGKSPLLDLTRRQAKALAEALEEFEVQCFIAMRYWHPLSDEAARQVLAFDPQQVLLLPLYPQFSTTTTGSSLAVWHEAAARAGLVKPTTTLCCWYAHASYIESFAALVRKTLADARQQLGSNVPVKLLFSAHGLPQSIVDAGDPYQFHIERTVENIIKALGPLDLDWQICYQSRATPEKWLEPSTVDAIRHAAAKGKAVVIAPVAFVSDHSETLVELDIEYAKLAAELGVPGYFRVPALNDHPAFVSALAELVREAVRAGPGLYAAKGGCGCPPAFSKCPNIHKGKA